MYLSATAPASGAATAAPATAAPATAAAPATLPPARNDITYSHVGVACYRCSNILA